MRLPARKTADRFEMQLGTNHLGHFALTGLLLERLLAAPAARVVTLSSTMHKPGRIWWDDLHLEQRYGPWRAYCQSKLANLLFSSELERRLRAAGAAAISVAAAAAHASANDCGVLPARGRTPSTMPYAAATPIAGAPRTARLRIASMSPSSVRRTSTRCSWGSLV